MSNIHEVPIELFTEVLGEPGFYGIDGEKVGEKVAIDRAVHAGLELDRGERTRPPLIKT